MNSRIDRMDALVRELSVQDDPDQLVRIFSRQADLVLPRDAVVSVSRRDLEPFCYRIPRSSLGRKVTNPWAKSYQSPAYDGGLLGQLVYAGRPAILNKLDIPADDPAADHLQGMRSLACAPS